MINKDAIPDPADDFEGCIDGTFQSVLGEIVGMSPAEQNAHFLAKAIQRLMFFRESGIAVLIERAEKNVARLEREREKRAASIVDDPDWGNEGASQ